MLASCGSDVPLSSADFCQFWGVLVSQGPCAIFQSAALTDRRCLFNAEQVLFGSACLEPLADLAGGSCRMLPSQSSHSSKGFLPALSANTPSTQGVKVHFAAPSARPPKSSLILFPFVMHDCKAPVTHNPNNKGRVCV